MNSNTRFEEIYTAYKNLVYNIALHYMQHSGDAEDITQETFIKVYQQLHTYNVEKASVKTWICRITVNQCIDFSKAKKSKKRSGLIINLFKQQTNEPVIEPEQYGHPGIAAEDKEQLNLLFRLINELPENQKTVLILLKIEDCPQKEVAEILGITVKAVESLFQRAKQSLEKKLKAAKDL